MDASLQSRAEQLASEIAGQATTAEDLNGLMRLMMKSALERMLDTEMDVHLGRKTARPTGENQQLGASGHRRGPKKAFAEPSQRPVEEDGPRRPGRSDHRHAA